MSAQVIPFQSLQPRPSMTDKPELQDGYTRIVNAVVEGLAQFPLTQLEARCVWAIVRKTYGYNKGKDRIAASQLAELMSSPEQPITRQKASTALAGLIRKNVVIREGGAQSAIKINTHTDQWTRPDKATKVPDNPKVNRNQKTGTENGSVNRNTVRNPNPKTVHTKDKKDITNSPSESSVEQQPDQSPELNTEHPPKKPGAAVQSPNGRKWGTGEDLDLAEAMAHAIDTRLGQDAPANRNMLTWANDIRLMREQDNRPLEAIRALFAWSQQDSFWRSNILSPAKLRKQWPTLAMQRNEQRQARGTGGSHGQRNGHNPAPAETGIDKQLTDLEYARRHF